MSVTAGACVMAASIGAVVSMRPSRVAAAARDASAPLASRCSSEVAAAIAAGVQRLFALDHEQAAAAFRRATAGDAECAIAWWGLALALLRLPDGDVAATTEAEAVTAMGRAQTATRVTAAERALIGAAVPLLDTTISRLGRLQAMAEASTHLSAADPSDRLAAFTAALTWLAVSTVPGDRAQRAAAQQVAGGRWAADDLAAATLSVLALDTADQAMLALPAARVVSTSQAASWRALHAAARVFARAGHWREASAAEDAALAVAGGVASPALLDEVPWYRHPLPGAMVADAQLGRFASARRRFDAARAEFQRRAATLQPASAWRLRAILDSSWIELRAAGIDWLVQPTWPDPQTAAMETIGGLAPPGGAPSDTQALASEVAARRAWVEGMGAARAAWPRGEPDRLAAARHAASTLEALARAHPRPPRFELLRTLVLAAIAAALEAREELQLLESHALALDRQVREAGEDWLLPASTARVLGDLRLLLRDGHAARRVFDGSAGCPCLESRCTLGLARALARSGEHDAAALAYARFAAQWATADEPRAELLEAASAAKMK